MRHEELKCHAGMIPAQDFAVFSDPAFDAKTWVNEALRPQNREPSTSADTHASGLVMKLQMFIQEVNNSLEATSEQVVQDLPRVVRSVDMVNQEVISLKDRIGAVKNEVEKVERETAESMRMLMVFDTVKTRMEATSSALQEADNWETLSADVDKAFASNNLPAMSSTLLGMQRSLMVLQDVPDYDQRQERVKRLQDQLEVALSPKLLKAFTEHNDAAARECAVTFRDMDRQNRVGHYYIQCHVTPLQASWQKLSADDASPLSTVLPIFYSEIEELWTAERAWAPVVFSTDSNAKVSQLICDVLAARTPSMHTVLKDDLGNGPDQLVRLVATFTATKEFASKLSARHPPLDTHVAHALLSPFFPYQMTYRKLQQFDLQHTAGDLTIPDKAGDLNALVAHVKETIPAVLSQMDHAVDTCFELTAGTACGDLVYCLNEFLSSVAAMLNTCVPRVARAVKDRQGASQGDVDDWAAAEAVFGLIESTGRLFLGLTQFENKLAARIAVITRPNYHEDEEANFSMLYHVGDKSWQEAALETHATAARPRVSVLGAALDELQEVNRAFHELAFDTVLAPLRLKLSTLSHIEDWRDLASIDDFSLSPLSYVTAVGEHLLTIPQQLEPFITASMADGGDNTSVGGGVGATDYLMVALEMGHLPVCLALPTKADASEDDISTADHWLEAVAKALVSQYVVEIKKIVTLTPKGCAQLCSDIEYLCNVLSALDIPAPLDLQHVNQLLAVDATQFSDCAAKIQASKEIVSRLCSARNITL